MLVHVHATWCPVCVKQEKAFNELSNHADFKKFTAINVNFDMDTDFRKAHNINNQSIIMVFKGGKQVSTKVGAASKGDLQKWISGSI